MSGAAATADYDLLVVNSEGKLVASSLNAAGRLDRINIQNRGATAQRLFVRVVYYSGPVGQTAGAYSLRVDLVGR